MADEQQPKSESAEIIKRLSAAGWHQTIKGEALGRAELEYDNGKISLLVDQGAEHGWLDLSIYDESDEGSDFSLQCPGKLNEVLDLIITFQDKISFDNYKEFLRELVKVADVYVDAGGDDFVPLRCVGAGGFRPR